MGTVAQRKSLAEMAAEEATNRKRSLDEALRSLGDDERDLRARRRSTLTSYLRDFILYRRASLKLNDVFKNQTELLAAVSLEDSPDTVEEQQAQYYINRVHRALADRTRVA